MKKEQLTINDNCLDNQNYWNLFCFQLKKILETYKNAQISTSFPTYPVPL